MGTCRSPVYSTNAIQAGANGQPFDKWLHPLSRSMLQNTHWRMTCAAQKSYKPAHLAPSDTWERAYTSTCIIAIIITHSPQKLISQCLKRMRDFPPVGILFTLLPPDFTGLPCTVSRATGTNCLCRMRTTAPVRRFVRCTGETQLHRTLLSSRARHAHDDGS